MQCAITGRQARRQLSAALDIGRDLFRTMAVLIEHPLLALAPAVLFTVLFAMTKSRLVLTAGLLWLAYFPYEYGMKLRILCSGEFNIRIDKKYERGYTASMKTAVSIPDNIFKSADTFAKRHGISRSELYATAIAEFLSRRRSRQVTARLDAVYEDSDSALEAEIADLQTHSIQHEKW